MQRMRINRCQRQQVRFILLAKGLNMEKMKSSKNLKWVVITLLAITATANSCLKRSDVEPVKPKTYISIMHMAPAAPAAEIYINNVKATQPMPSGSTFSYYSAIDPGVYDIKFKKASSDSLVASLPASTYDSSKFYTLVLYNEPQGSGAVAAKIADDFSSMTEDKMAYRFFNLSPDATAVDFYINDEKLSSGRESADNIDNNYFNLFQNKAAGTYKITAKIAGTSTVLAQTQEVSFAAANAYTIFLKGRADASGEDGLKLVVLRALN